MNTSTRHKSPCPKAGKHPTPHPTPCGQRWRARVTRRHGTRASATFGMRLEAQAWLAGMLKANSRLDAPTRDIDRALLGTVNARAPRARSEVRHG